jgi:hypothetical protein
VALAAWLRYGTSGEEIQGKINEKTSRSTRKSCCCAVLQDV